jgi:hypothetical protein
MSMRLWLCGLCTVAFLGLPAVLLMLRWARPRWMPWWAVGLVTLTAGWALVFGAAVTFERPPESSGAPEVFALMFGWLYAVAWLLPHLALYGAIRGGLRILRPAASATEPPRSQPS